MCANLSNDVDNSVNIFIHKVIHKKENPVDKPGFGAEFRPLNSKIIGLGSARQGNSHSNDR